MGRLDGKVAVITGASMGIGEATARLFAQEGAAVIICSRDQGRVEAARGRILAAAPDAAGRTLALACDVRYAEEIDRVLSLTVHNFGRVDIWINNAGYGLRDSIASMDMEQCRAMFDTNLFAAIYGMQVAIAAMKRQGGGTVINISSVAGHIPVAGSGAYSATKFALNAIGKAARVELMGSGIHVMTVCPGFIANDFGRNVVRGKDPQYLHQGARRGPGSEVVASAILNGYLKGKREVVVPAWYHIMIKLYQLFPGLVEYGMARYMRRGQAAPVEPQAVARKN
jgi:short-subunit dehydrogenase